MPNYTVHVNAGFSHKLNRTFRKQITFNLDAETETAALNSIPMRYLDMGDTLQVVQHSASNQVEGSNIFIILANAEVKMIEGSLRIIPVTNNNSI